MTRKAGKLTIAAVMLLLGGCRNLTPPPASWQAGLTESAPVGQLADAPAALADGQSVESGGGVASRPVGAEQVRDIAAAEATPRVADNQPSPRQVGGRSAPSGSSNTARPYPTTLSDMEAPAVPFRSAATWFDSDSAVVRGQAPTMADRLGQYTPGSNGMPRGPMPVSGVPTTNVAPAVVGEGGVQPVQYTAPGPDPFLPPPPAGYLPGVADPVGVLGPTVPLDINVAETRTGRFMFGAGVNSDLGVTGQISIDERNFDFWRAPRSWDDFTSGRAWRGGGQALRIEAMPGSQVQRYMASLTEPYLFDTNVSLNLSGYYFDRVYEDWKEQRLGGRVSLGYRLTPDLSASAALRMENVNINDPPALVPELAEVLGNNALFSGRFTLAHDTRDSPYFPSEGHYVELAYEQVFGSFSYPRAEAEYRQYFLVKERPDGSGRHTLAYSFRAGISGTNTPLFENYFAGGFSTLRGFDFRGASPVNGSVEVGGEFRFLGSMEYLFPLTADDMVKGVLFVDYGTVEEKVSLHMEDYRVAPGLGLRIAIPALGPAPLALDFAFPVARENTDDVQNFSFYFGMGRN